LSTFLDLPSKQTESEILLCFERLRRIVIEHRGRRGHHSLAFQIMRVLTIWEEKPQKFSAQTHASVRVTRRALGKSPQHTAQPVFCQNLYVRNEN
jgi:hypothetical protein